MQSKLLFLIISYITLTSSTPAGSKPGKILRTPKVYNAVITTDDNLAPSRAYPLIQPIVHETPIAYPYHPAFNSFRYYDYSPYQTGFAPPQSQLQSRFNQRPLEEQTQAVPETPLNSLPETGDQQPLPQHHQQRPLQRPPQPQLNYNSNDRIDKGPEILSNSQPEDDKQRPKEKAPIPLNQFGLPPSLVPVSSFHNPYNLQPYSYTSYPLIYDSFGGYHQPPLLPPYAYYPPTGPQPHERPYPSGPQEIQPVPQPLQPEHKIEPQRPSNGPPPQSPPLLPPSGPAPADVINYANKNKDIPDVPPPPLPTSSRKNKE